jgi:xanthine dehydrogenase YagT iron-sulfur-binding subunit
VSRVSGPSGARLLGVAGSGAWRELSFSDAALAIPVLAGDDGTLARHFGVPEGGPAVLVLDGDGAIRWAATSDALPSPDEVARALASAAPPHRAWTRREFVAAALGACVAFALLPRDVRGAPAPARGAPPDAAPPAGTVHVTLRVNGRDVPLDVEPRVTLLDALRERAGLTGTKKGCDHGQCGACTVHVDGRRVLSCLTLAVMAQGKAITTIEGLAASAGAANGATGDALHPMQQAFLTHDGFQCGYCTPGQIMSATAVLREPWGPDDADVREAMSGNICRCGAYPGIVAAVQSVRRQTATDGTSTKR